MVILYFFITVYTAYYIILSLFSLKRTRKIRDKYVPNDTNLCVAIYATGNCKNLEKLLHQLKNQKYSNINYTIYLILDKCEEVPEIALETDLLINAIRINNLEPIGKSQAYSIIAEKMSESTNIDAFVFLDAKNYIEEDFFASIKYYLTKYDAFIPMINYINEERDLTFWENVKSTYSRYIYLFFYRTRTLLGLISLWNSNAFVIKKSLLDKVQNFEFSSTVDELEYSFRIAEHTNKFGFIENLNVYRNIKDFEYRIPSLSNRFRIFKEKFFNSNGYKSKEFALSLIQPNFLTVIAVYALLLKHTFQFPFIVSYITILISFIVFALAFCTSLFNTKIYAKEYIFLFAYPLLSIWNIVNNFPPVRFIKNFIKEKSRVRHIETMTTEVIVTDGNRDFKCQLEMISDEGLAKVKFINKNKTYMTKNQHIRMTDAIRELSDKMSDYGLSLKICQCCKHFRPTIDGTTNMIQGTCQCQFSGRTPGDIIPTLAWNTCPNFEQNNIVKLF